MQCHGIPDLRGHLGWKRVRPAIPSRHHNWSIKSSDHGRDRRQTELYADLINDLQGTDGSGDQAHLQDSLHDRYTSMLQHHWHLMRQFISSYY